MRLIDFLIYLLETQANTLKRLAAFFGEEEFFQMLELAGDLPDAPEIPLDASLFIPPKTSNTPSAYAQLEGAVKEFGLPSVLEFHLWAYPHYRSFIESSVDLRSMIRDPHGMGGEILINEALKQAKLWISRLPIHPELSSAAEQAALIPWLRFRAEVLKKMGKRPIASLI